MLKAATQELEAERDALCVTRRSSSPGARRPLPKVVACGTCGPLADEAHTRLLRAMTLEEQAQVLALLQVRVTVLGWTDCSHCAGKGNLPGASGGVMCPSCRMMRSLPTVRVEGTVLEDVLLEQVEGEVTFPTRS